jgi:hypothetical protein
MSSPLSFDRLILFTALWWVFATVVAFIAATVLWNRGTAQLAGKIPALDKMSVRFTGAGALWCFTLLLFCAMRPEVLKPHKNVMVIYAKPQPDSSAQVEGGESIEVKNLDIDLSGRFTYELIRRDGIFGLMPGDEERLELDRSIPAGFYELRITDTHPQKGSDERSRSIAVKIPQEP